MIKNLFKLTSVFLACQSVFISRLSPYFACLSFSGEIEQKFQWLLLFLEVRKQSPVKHNNQALAK